MGFASGGLAQKAPIGPFQASPVVVRNRPIFQQGFWPDSLGKFEIMIVAKITNLTRSSLRKPVNEEEVSEPFACERGEVNGGH